MNNGRSPYAQPLRMVEERHIPVSGLVITATTSGAAQTWATAGATGLTQIERLTVINTTGTTATLTFYSIPSGDSIGDANMELDAASVPANTTLRLDRLLAGDYAPGTTFKAFSGTNGALVLRGALVERA